MRHLKKIQVVKTRNEGRRIVRDSQKEEYPKIPNLRKKGKTDPTLGDPETRALYEVPPKGSVQWNKKPM